MPLNAGQVAALGRLFTAASGVSSQSKGTTMKWSVGCVFDPNNQNDVRVSTAYTSGMSTFQAPDWVYNAKNFNSKSVYDSEVKVLADLESRYDAELRNGYDVVMYSSDGPCKSCKGVIKMFVDYYQASNPALTAAVVYCKQAYNATAGGVWPTPVMYGYGDEQQHQSFYYKEIN